MNFQLAPWSMISLHRPKYTFQRCIHHTDIPPLGSLVYNQNTLQWARMTIFNPHTRCRKLWVIRPRLLLTTIAVFAVEFFANTRCCRMLTLMWVVRKNNVSGCCTTVWPRFMFTVQTAWNKNSRPAGDRFCAPWTPWVNLSHAIIMQFNSGSWAHRKENKT